MTTRTLLDTCNEALLQVGERKQATLTTPTGEKARLAVCSSIDFCSRMHSWRHLHVTVSSTNWLNGVVTLPPFQELYQASSGTTIMRLVNPESIQNEVVRNTFAGLPIYCSVVGENQVLVYPTPDLATRNAMQFRLLLEPTIPSLAADIIDLPSGFLELVVLYAQIILHRTHTTDLSSAEAALRQFEVGMHMYRTRNNFQAVSYMGA